MWDQDLIQDDLVAFFDVKGGSLLALKEKSRLLSSASVQLSLTWQPQPKARDQISAPDELRVVQVKPVPESYTMQKRGQESALSSRGKSAQVSAQATTYTYSTCVQVHRKSELTLTFALEDVPGGGRAVLSNLRELAEQYRDRLRASQIKVTHCLEGADLTSRMGLGTGWVRVHNQTLKVDIHRSYLGRTLMRGSDLKALLIRKLCYRALELRAPQCKQFAGSSR